MTLDQPLQAFESGERAFLLAKAIVDTVREPLLALDQDLRIIVASRSFHRTFETTRPVTQGHRIYDLDEGLWISRNSGCSLAVAAAVYMMVVPPTIEPAFGALIDRLGDGLVGSIAAAGALLFLPLMLVSVFLPFAVRLLLRDTAHGGRVSGRIYGVSTVGNILGTLLTTFTLMPRMGTRHLTLGLAVLVGLTGLALIVLDRRRAG